jgi:hypothetical protein
VRPADDSEVLDCVHPLARRRVEVEVIVEDRHPE